MHVYSARSFNFLAVANNPELIGVLTQIDITLITSLLLLIAFGGYTNFIFEITTDNEENRPDWAKYVEFSDLKLKLSSSIVAISSEETHKCFINAKKMLTQPNGNQQLAWLVK